MLSRIADRCWVRFSLDLLGVMVEFLATLRRLIAVGLVLLASATLGASSVHAADSPNGVEDGLVLWLDASNPNGNGIRPDNGDQISQWVDRSSANNDAVGFGQPATYDAHVRTLNGRPALRFTRVSDYSGTGFYAPNLDIRAVTRPDLTVFTVYQPLVVVANNGLWGNDNGEWDRFFLSYHPGFGDSINDGLVSLGPTLQGETIPDAGDPTVAHLMTVGYDGKFDRWGNNIGEEDGSYVYTDCAVQRRFTDSSNSSNAQSYFYVGSDGDNSAFDGYIAELIVYERALTEDELIDVYMYLSTKYNLGSTCAGYVFDTTTTVGATEPEVLANTGSRSVTWYPITVPGVIAGCAFVRVSRRRAIR